MAKKKKIKVFLDRNLLVWHSESSGIYVENNETPGDRLPPLFLKELEKFKKHEEEVQQVRSGNISSDEYLKQNEEYLRMGKLLQKYLGNEYEVDIVFGSDKVWWNKEKDCISYD